MKPKKYFGRITGNIPPLDVIWFAKTACDLRPVLAPDCGVHGLALALDERLLTANTPSHDGVGHHIHFGAGLIGDLPPCRRLVMWRNRLSLLSLLIADLSQSVEFLDQAFRGADLRVLLAGGAACVATVAALAILLLLRPVHLRVEVVNVLRRRRQFWRRVWAAARASRRSRVCRQSQLRPDSFDGRLGSNDRRARRTLAAV